MTTTTLIRAAVAAGALVLAAPAHADEAAADESLNLRYEVYWGGMHAADFVLTTQRVDGRYDNAFRLRTRGVFDWLLNLDIAARSTGLARAALPLAPHTYDVDFANRWRRGDITMRFDPETGAIESTYRADPPRDDPESGRTVGPADRQGALDPLAAFLEGVRRAGAQDERTFRLKIFDGRRRFDATGEVLGPVHRDIAGTGYDTLHLRLATHPIAGFNQRQLELWDGKVYDIFLSTDGRLLPLKVNAEGMGPHINLVEECPTYAACALPEDGAQQSTEQNGIRPAG